MKTKFILCGAFVVYIFCLLAIFFFKTSLRDLSCSFYYRSLKNEFFLRFYFDQILHILFIDQRLITSFSFVIPYLWWSPLRSERLIYADSNKIN